MEDEEVEIQKYECENWRNRLTSVIFTCIQEDIIWLYWKVRISAFNEMQVVVRATVSCVLSVAYFVLQQHLRSVQFTKLYRLVRA